MTCENPVPGYKARLKATRSAFSKMPGDGDIIGPTGWARCRTKKLRAGSASMLIQQGKKDGVGSW